MNCGDCGRTVQTGDLFCPGCGAKLSTAPPRADEGERRQLTLLFYDLVGSTELSTRADPEDLQLVISRFQEMCSRIVRDVGGYPAKTMGDGGLAYFGYPVTHEDDPFRAVMAGQSIIDELAVLNDAIRAEMPSFTDRLQMRIGIHSGTVVIGSEGSDLGTARLAIGEALNIASRVESAAPANGVAVSEVTARRVQGVVDLTSLGPVSLKGIEDPLEIFVVERVRPGQSRFTSVRSLGPFVGRDDEAQRLHEAWATARDGRAAMVLIRGDAGLGKSRLHSHLRHQLGGTRHAWFELFGSPVMSQSAFHPIVQVINQLLQLEDLSTAEQRERLESALTEAGLGDDHQVAAIAHLLRIDQDEGDAQPAEARRRATINAVCDWWLAIAQLLPTVIVAEDVHWFDPSTLEVLGELWRRADADSLLLIVTTRPGTDLDWDGEIELIELEPLPLEDAAALVDRLADHADLSPIVRAQIAARSDGVPLFAEELVQAAVSDGGGGGAVPETLRELMSARLDRLGPAKEVLQLAALLGREFPRDQLAAVAAVDDLDATLDVLIEQNFIARRSAGERAAFLFRHALLQDAARDSMLRRRRESEHRRIASLLVERFSGTPDGRPEIIGHHFAEGAEPWLAAEQFQLAGREAVRRSALQEGAAHLTRSIEVLGELEPDPKRHRLELELHVQLGSALALSDGMRSPRATEVHERAVELCRVSDPDSLYPNALNGVFQSRLTSAEFDAALEVGAELLRWAEESGQRTHQVAAHAALAQVHFWPGRYTECWVHASKAWELYDPTDPPEARQAVGIDSGVTALCFGAVGAWALGHIAESVEMADRCIDLASEQDDVYQLAFAQAYLSMHAVMLNDPSRCERLARGGQDLSTRHGFLPMAALSTYTLGWARAELGDPDGLDIARDGVNQLAGMGVGIGAPGCMAVLAEMCAKAGEVDEGFGYAGLGEAMAAESQQHFYTAEIHRSVALLHLELADRATGAEAESAIEAAEAAARASIDVARAQRAPSLELRAVEPMVSVLERRGDRDAARSLLASTVAQFPESSRGIDLDRARAEIDSATSRPSSTFTR